MQSAEDPMVRVPDSELDYDEELTYRWNGKLFTGIGYDDSSQSGLSEVSYRFGLQDGAARDWYPSGALKGESEFREGVQHGIAKEYAENGDVMSEAIYEYGILLRRSELSEIGQLRQLYLLSEDSPNGRLLERFRMEKGWPEIG